MEFKKIEKDKGKKINNKYIIQKTLGQGTYGKVFLVNEIDTNKEFAIKVSLKENSEDANNEIRILKRLSEIKKQNKNTKEKSYIIDIIDDFKLKTKTEKGQKLLTYIVLEYMPKKTLADYFMGIEKTITRKICKIYIFKNFKRCSRNS